MIVVYVREPGWDRGLFIWVTMFMLCTADLQIPLTLLSQPQVNVAMTNDTFEIPITWKGNEISFAARLIPTGYVTRIAIDIYGEEVVLEPDEEGQYRVVMETDASGNYPEIDIPLVREIAHVLSTVNGAH